MARYDFLDEKTQKKLEERQEKIITKKKQDEIKESRSKGGKGEEKSESEGPEVYTTDKGEIGGVIYPKGKSEVSKKPSKQIMGKKETQNKKKGSSSEDLPIKLHHTDKTKVGTEDRPKPPDKEKLNQESGQKPSNDEEEEDARGEIWK